MTLKKPRLVVSILVILSFNSFAGGYLVPEQANPAIGTANVGQAAYANDASTAYFNPAGMTQLNSSQLMLGTQVIMGNIQFKPNQYNTFSGGNGGQAASLLPGAGIFGVINWSPDLKFGLGITSPMGGDLSYTDGWTGRYFVQDTLFLALNINPSVAYRVNDWLSIGGGGSLEYALLHENVAAYRPNAPQDDGQTNVKTDNYAGGFNFGLLFTPTAHTRAGLAYRSKITHNLKGKSSFLRLDFTPSITTQIIAPQNIILSGYHDLNDKLTVVAEFGWNNWRQLKDTFLQVADVSLTIPLDWHDTYHVGAGIEYQWRPQIKLQTGISYDSSPTSTAKRLPDLPVDQQLRVGTGIVYTTQKNTKIGVQTEYVNFGKAAMQHPTPIGTFAGDYGNNNYAFLLATNVNIDL